MNIKWNQLEREGKGGKDGCCVTQLIGPAVV